MIGNMAETGLRWNRGQGLHVGLARMPIPLSPWQKVDLTTLLGMVWNSGVVHELKQR